MSVLLPKSQQKVVMWTLKVSGCAAKVLIAILNEVPGRCSAPRITGECANKNKTFEEKISQATPQLDGLADRLYGRL